MPLFQVESIDLLMESDDFGQVGQLEKVRDMYEEAINEVNTVKDFSLASDAKFEESLLNARMRSRSSEHRRE